MSLSNAFEVLVLDKIFRNTDFTVATVYVSLHTADPGDTGASEVAGGTYARQSASFDAAATPGGTNANSGAISFTSMPAATITHFGFWNAGGTSGGTFIAGGTLTASKALSLGDTFQFAAGGITGTLA